MFIIENTKVKIINTTVNEKTNDGLIVFLNKDFKKPANKISLDVLNNLGTDVLKRLEDYKDLNYNDCYTFNSGNLDYDILFNCILPENINSISEWEILFSNLKMVLKEYKRLYPLRDITLYFVIVNKGILELLFNLIQELGFTSLNIIVDNEKHYEQIYEFLDKQKKNPIINKFFDSLISKISKIF